MSDPHQQQPVASGDLARTPFAHLVLYLYQKRSSGTLIIQGAGAEYRALFHRGRAVAAAVPQPSAAGPAPALDDALIELAGWASGAFGFYDADLVGSGSTVVTGMFDPFAFVVRAARSLALEGTVQAVLSKYAGMSLMVDASTDWSRLGLTDDEQQLASVLKQAPSSPEALFAQLDLNRDAARRLLYSLLIVHAVVPESSPNDNATESGLSHSLPASRASAASVRSGAVAGRASDTTRDLRPSRGSGDAWRAIATAAGAMAERRPATDPNVAPLRSSRPSVPSGPSQGAQGEAAAQRVRSPSNQTTPRAITRPLSPSSSGFDRTASRPMSRPLSEPLSIPSARPDSRPTSSTSPRQRDSLTGLPRARQSTPLPRGATPRPSLPDISTLDADGKFRRVELLCQRNAFNDALTIIRGLLDEDKKSAKYLGMLAHVLYGRTTDANFPKELVDSVNQALRIDGDQLYALYTKARCYKRLGKEREALHYFRRTLGIDPNHLDAAREARLLVSRLADRKKR